MTPPNPPATRHDTEADARERLLAAAQDAFAQHGFEGATVRDICRAAGANIAAVNYYFGDKEKLYIEAVKRAHVCATQMDTFPVLPPGTPPAEKLRTFIREMVRRHHAPVSPTAMKLMMREMTDPGKAAHVVVSEFIRPVAEKLRAVIAELLPGLDGQHQLMTAFSVISQCLFYRQNRQVAELIVGKDAMAALDVEAVADHVARFTLAALGFAEPLQSDLTPRPPSLTGKGEKTPAGEVPLPPGLGRGRPRKGKP